jgi:hypothetical protein
LWAVFFMKQMMFLLKHYTEHAQPYNKLF